MSKFFFAVNGSHFRKQNGCQNNGFLIKILQIKIKRSEGGLKGYSFEYYTFIAIFLDM